MQIRIQITANDIRVALDRHQKGWTMETPVSVALERNGYKGAVHSPDGKHLWCYDVTGKTYMKVPYSKRLHRTLAVWRKTQVCIPATYIVDAHEVLDEPHFPGYSQEGKKQ